MGLGGWSPYSMVRTYARLAPDHLARFDDSNLGSWDEVGEGEGIASGTKLAQSVAY